MENISLCTFQYLTLYYVINIYNSVFVVEAIFNYEGNMSVISGHEPDGSRSWEGSGSIPPGKILKVESLKCHFLASCTLEGDLQSSKGNKML